MSSASIITSALVASDSSATATVQRPGHAQATSVLQPLNPGSVPWPPHLPLAGHEAGSFAEATITQRLPSIIASMVKDIQQMQLGAELAPQVSAAVSDIEAMRQEMLRGGEPADLAVPPGASPHLAASVASTNQALAAWRGRLAPGTAPTWLNLPWLLVECYMYVRIAVALHGKPGLSDLRPDPFSSQKRAAFLKSRGGISSMAAEVEGLVQRHAPGASEEEVRGALYQVVQYSLWGNKTDLSLLVDASKIDPAAFAKAQEQEAAGQPFVIVDEFEGVWRLLREHMRRAAGGKQAGTRRVDIILDNAGLELYSDMCLADVLLQYGLADEVVFHGKPMPWFVSDTLASDFDETLRWCTEEAEGLDTPASWAPVQRLAQRWQSYLSSGKWRYTHHAFWCTPAPLAWMSALCPDLHGELRNNSMLMVFKGDLNYRKLTHDCRWPYDTPFGESIQGFGPAPFVSLRTLKADVVAGLKPGQGQALFKVDPDWLVNGKFGMIQAHVPASSA